MCSGMTNSFLGRRLVALFAFLIAASTCAFSSQAVAQPAASKKAASTKADKLKKDQEIKKAADAVEGFLRGVIE